MQNFARPFMFFLSLLTFLTSCQDKEFDEHYGRPDWLPSPVYQQLQSRGNFKNFLACIDKADYKRTLSGAGYFTVFAPNDAAFEAFMNEHQLPNIDAIDEDMARKIVTYALVYNSFDRARLADYQSNLGWQPVNAFKRRTAYYDGVYTETLTGGETIQVTAANRNGGYVFGDNNNKYIPYFIDSYFAAKSLTSFDYNYFYPNSTFSGFNVADASVVTADIQAENGMIHEVNKVILPLPSIDSYIGSKPEYSVFMELLKKYQIIYLTHPEVTERYRVMTGSDKPVYVKFYSGALAFSPNNENFLKATDNDGQSDGWTMFVPNNEATTKYINEVLTNKDRYKSLDEMPPAIINDFINAHMWQTSVWPSKFKSVFNFLGEEARFDLAADIVDRKVLSNGMLYGTSKAQDADVFRSVFGRAYLDPKYSLMTRFLSRELKTTIISPHVKFTLFLVPDEVLRGEGHNFNITNNEWVYNGTTNQAVENWTRMINMHVMITQNNELSDLSGKGIVETYGGEFIKYDNNTVFAAGNLEEATTVMVNTTEAPSVNAHNGIVHYATDFIRFPDNAPVKGPGFYIRDQGDAASKPFKRFYDYLKSSDVFIAASGDIVGVSSGVFHTFFIPSNEAIDQAVADGVLPATATPTSPADKDKISNFILYHILPKFSIIHNGKEEGSFESLYKILGDPTVLTVSNKPGVEFTVTDMKGRTAKVNADASNVLGNRAVFHQIDKYLRY